MIDRRQFLLSSLALAASAGCSSPRSQDVVHSLRKDPAGILDLAPGFEYRVLARSGERMSDGLLSPARPDGMGAFDLGSGKLALVVNHENLAGQNAYSAFGKNLELLPEVDKELIYDFGHGKQPGTGGTSTLLYNRASGSIEQSYLSLAGTELNCAGGITPWGSWLSCEECFDPYVFQAYPGIAREKKHGYIFEVDPRAGSLQAPKVLYDLGRFVHEAAAIDPISGNVYLTEDQRQGLFYRFVPEQAGDLGAGGQLQALAFVDEAITDTANYTERPDMPLQEWLPVRWIDIDDPEGGEYSHAFNQQGAQLGAARFVRGEGIWYDSDELFFACTEGGPDKAGQIFRLRLAREAAQPDELMLFVESDKNSLLRQADNLTVSPWGDLLICEDRSDQCSLIAVRKDGSTHSLAQNRAAGAELAGACFAPDGDELFLNLQKEGLTVVISGPFKEFFAG